MTEGAIQTSAGPDHFRLLVIIPAYNEASAIAQTIRSLDSLPVAHDVLVVSDGSTDATSAIARQAGAVVLDLPCNMGVGAAMQAGYQYAFRHDYPAAIQFDGDGQHRADQVPALLAPVLADQADLVVGSRALAAIQQEDYRFSLDRRVGSRLLAGLLCVLLKRRITDPTSGFRASNRRAISFFSRHYPQAWLGDTVEAMVELGRHGYRIAEVPTRMAPRQGGRSAAGTIKGFMHTLRIIVAVLIDCIERKFDDEISRGEP